MEMIFIETKQCKASQLATKIRLIDKYVSLQYLSIYYTWKNIRQQYINNKLKIIAPTWNDEFELADGSYSVSNIQDYIKYIIRKHESSSNLPIRSYINKINTLVFKIKGGYKLGLQTP